MNLSVSHLQQYKKIAALLWKYGRSDVVKGMGLGDEVDTQTLAAQHPGDASPTELADDLEAMGPTYVKLGGALQPPGSFAASLYTGFVAAARRGQALLIC